MLRVTLPLIFVLASTSHAQTSKLIKSQAPAPATVAGYDKGHCIALPKNIRICKLLSDDKDTFLVERDGQRVGTWPGKAFLAETSDFEVLTGDLDNDGQPELIVANHEGTSNGMAVEFWTIFIFPDPDFRTFKSPLAFNVEEYGSFGTFVTTAGRVNILTTSWISAKDPKGRRGFGTYLVGQWWRYKAGELKPLINKPPIARRYLASFAGERFDTVKLDRIPFRWLSHPNTETVDTAFIARKEVEKWPGIIQVVSTETNADKLKVVFKPNDRSAMTFIYPFAGGSDELAYFGDAASGWVYPSHYLPAEPKKWLQNRRATLRTYEDRGVQILWLER